MSLLCFSIPYTVDPLVVPATSILTRFKLSQLAWQQLKFENNKTNRSKIYQAELFIFKKYLIINLNINYLPRVDEQK